MSGHSKWATIKRKKAKEDAKRGKAFTNIIKEITIVARTGGGDPAGNPRLRTLLEKAKAINMPIENTVRAIKRGTGELPGSSYEAITYEGYTPGRVAVIVDALTDNKNRTVAELRHLFASKGGTFAETGSVSWMFQRKGVVRVPSVQCNEDQLLEMLIDYDVTDIMHEDGVLAVVCDQKALDTVKQTLEKANIKVESADLEWVPTTTVNIAENQEQTVLDFLELLEDHDDVKNVYSNLA